MNVAYNKILKPRTLLLQPLLDLPFILRKIAPDNGQIKPPQNRFLRLSLQQKLKRFSDQFFGGNRTVSKFGVILWSQRDLMTRLASAFNNPDLETRLIKFFHFDFCLHEFSVFYEE